MKRGHKHVAGNAKKGPPNRKIMARLEARRTAFDKSHRPGEHRPGSMQKK